MRLRAAKMGDEVASVIVELKLDCNQIFLLLNDPENEEIGPKKVCICILYFSIYSLFSILYSIH